MDGARISNAAAYLGCTLKEMTTDAGIDMLSFGGTKNGLMIGEAIVCLRKEFASELKYIRKQGMQLGSKMRFISAQFNRLLADDLWLENAAQANRMAMRLAKGLQKFPGVTLTQPVESNAVFASVPIEQIQHLQKSYSFALWNAEKNEIRLVASFDTTEEDVDLFLSTAQKVFA